VGEEVQGGLGMKWQERARLLLLKQVAEELPKAIPAGRAPALDIASETLHDLFQQQARLRGVPAADVETAKTPGAVLRLLVEHAGRQLAGKELRPADRQFVAGLTHQLAAVDYLRRNDLHLTALAQRTYLRLLAAELVARRPHLATDADQVVSELHAQDAKAPHVLTQLRDGEAALLKLWAHWHAPEPKKNAKVP
jgi:hypothetical protein